MKIVKVSHLGHIQEGDTLIITGDTLINEVVKAVKVKKQCRTAQKSSST